VKSLVRTVAWICATVVGLALLWRLRDLITLLGLSLIFSSALHPVMSALRRRLRLPRVLAVLLVHLVGVGVLVGGVALLVGPLLTEISGLTATALPAYAAQLTAWSYRDGAWGELAKILPSPQALATSLSELGLTSVVHGVVTVTGAVLDGVVAVLLVLVFSIALSLQRDGLSRFVVMRIPARWRGRARTVVTDLRTVVGFQLVGGILKLLTVLVVLVPTYRAVGLSVPTLAATAVALFAAVPLVGRPLALLTVLVVASPVGTTVWVALSAGTFAFLWALDAGMPRLLRTRRDHAFTAIILILVLAKLVGWMGLLLAPLLAPVLHEVATFFLELKQQATLNAPIVRSELEERIDALEARALETRRNRRALSLVRRLRGLLEESGAS